MQALSMSNEMSANTMSVYHVIVSRFFFIPSKQAGLRYQISRRTKETPQNQSPS